MATAAVAARPNPLTGFTVVDASANPQTVLATLTNGDTLTLDDPQGGSYGIRVDIKTGAEIRSVRLQMTGGRSEDKTENVAPYSLHGDNGDDDLGGGNLPVGSYTPDGNGLLERQPRRRKTGSPDRLLHGEEDQHAGRGISHDQWYGPGGTDADGKHVGHCRRRRADQRLLRPPVAGRRSGHLRGHRLHLRPHRLRVGKTIQVKESFTDNANNPETLTSVATAAVAARPNPLTGFTVVDASANPQTVLATLTGGDTLTLDDPQGGSFGIRVGYQDGLGDRQRPAANDRRQVRGQDGEHPPPTPCTGTTGMTPSTAGTCRWASYTLTATAYSKKDRGGEELGALTVSFTVEAARS